MTRAALAAWVLFAILHLGGCAAWSPRRQVYERYARLDAELVPSEVERWGRVAGDGAGASDPERGAAHLRLALLYSHPDNPEARFDLALEHLDSYAALDPEGARDAEIRRLRAVLEDLSRCVLRGERRKEVTDLLWKDDQEVRRRLEALQRDSRGMSQVVGSLFQEQMDLRRENERLQQRARELEENAQDVTRQNAELRQTIEQLKKLDLQMEKIRSGKGTP